MKILIILALANLLTVTVSIVMFVAFDSIGSLVAIPFAVMGMIYTVLGYLEDKRNEI